MKAKKVKLKNFGAYAHFEAEFPDGNIDIIGENGAGKSTLIKSFLACLKGIGKVQGGLVGERYQFIGGVGKTADVEWTLTDSVMGVDVIIKNHISKTGNDISFTSPEGSNLDKAWLEKLFNVALMSTKQFCSHSPREQAQLLGINTDKFDVRIQNLKEEFTLLNRDLSNFGELGEEPEKVEEVKTDELALELEELNANKYERTGLESDLKGKKLDHETGERSIATLEKELKEAKEELEKHRLLIKKAQDKLDHFVDPTEQIEKVNEKIKTASEENEKFTTWKTWNEDTEKKETAQGLVDANKKLQKDQTQLKIDHLKTFKFPFTDMGVDDKGGLTLKDRHINENGYSQGELELIVAKISITLNPELRLRMIDDAKLLDEKMQPAIQKQLEKEGFQVMWFLVGDKKTDSNSILLRECKSIESYDEKKNLI